MCVHGGMFLLWHDGNDNLGVKAEYPYTVDVRGEGHDPTLKRIAQVTVTVSVSEGNDFTIPSLGREELRMLVGGAQAGLDYLDRVAPELLEERSDGCYFIGDLEQGKVLAYLERTVHIGRLPRSPDAVGVALCDQADCVKDFADCQTTAEWGSGQNEEEAWRFALGAFFGPDDDGYDPARLAAALERGTWVDEP